MKVGDKTSPSPRGRRVRDEGQQIQQTKTRYMFLFCPPSPPPLPEGEGVCVVFVFLKTPESVMYGLGVTCVIGLLHINILQKTYPDDTAYFRSDVGAGLLPMAQGTLR